MLDVLKFIFEDFFHFLGICIFLMIFVMWKPVEINVMNGYWKESKDDGEDGV